MASAGTVSVDCPACGAVLDIPVHTEVDGRADNGVLQVAVVADKAAVVYHARVCDGGGFYEDDAPVADLLAKFDTAAERGKTARTKSGRTG